MAALATLVIAVAVAAWTYPASAAVCSAVQIESFTISPTPATDSETPVGNVALKICSSPTQVFSVTLSSSDPSVASVPARLPLVGQTSGAFNIGTHPVVEPKEVTITVQVVGLLNQVIASASQPLKVLPAYVGKLTDHGVAAIARLTIQPYGMPLTVRTVNLCMNGKTCDDHLQNRDPGRLLRLQHIARRFYEDSPAEAGVIGVQQVTRAKESSEVVNPAPPLQCPLLGRKAEVSECLAAELEQLYRPTDGRKFNWTEQTEVGVVAGHEWDPVPGKPKSWVLTGSKKDSPKHPRSMIEIVLQHHRYTDLRVRLYSLRLSSHPTKDAGLRHRQVKQIVKLIQGRAKDGELPPIVVGDFNHYRRFSFDENSCREACDFPEVSDESVPLMEEYFERPIDLYKDTHEWTKIDIVYVGKKEAFPLSRGYYEVRDHQWLEMGYIPPRIEEAKRLGCLQDGVWRVSTVQFRFSREGEPIASFDVDDVVPRASVIERDKDDPDYTLVASFVRLKCVSSVELGPMVHDVRGFWMDQNRDGWASRGIYDAYRVEF